MDGIALGFDFYIAAMSSAVWCEAEGNGDWDALIATGACVLPIEYGLCLGLGMHLLEEGKMGISMTCDKQGLTSLLTVSPTPLLAMHRSQPHVSPQHV